jgi:hypothetical protein
MFYALSLSAWIEHPVCRYLLGFTPDEGLVRSRGLVPAIISGVLLAVATAVFWLFLPNSIGFNLIFLNLFPLVSVVSPLLFLFIAGVIVAFATTRRLWRNPMFRDLLSAPSAARESLDAMLSGLAVRALVLAGLYFHTLIVLFFTFGDNFSRNHSPLFLFFIAAIAVLLGGSLILDHALLIGVRAALQQKETPLLYFAILPGRLLQMVGALILGVGVGGLAWLAQEVERTHEETEKLLQDRLENQDE